MAIRFAAQCIVETNKKEIGPVETFLFFFLIRYYVAAGLLQCCGVEHQSCAIAVVHARPLLGSQVTVCVIISFCFVNNLSTEVEDFEQPAPGLVTHIGLSTITGKN